MTEKKSIAPDWTGPRINHEEFAAKLFARRAALEQSAASDKESVMKLSELGDLVMERRAALDTEFIMPRNDGKRRTPSKRALLKAIKEAGGQW
jgi:hypothetical protein